MNAEQYPVDITLILLKAVEDVERNNHSSFQAVANAVVVKEAVLHFRNQVNQNPCNHFGIVKEKEEMFYQLFTHEIRTANFDFIDFLSEKLTFIINTTKDL
jgi:hypothetical protein